ncbi:hypothetical protein, partial [Nonlabens sp.]|uniref:hypothetical protein n=1 Tax=Nonlabens sp. TaxID=1888209 RepID=UPI0025E9DFF1
YKLKNKLSFKPTKVSMYMLESGFLIDVKYSGKNSYGAESLSQSYFTFKNEDDVSVEHSFTK